MEFRRLVIGMALAMAIVFLWPTLFAFIGKQLGYDMTPAKIAQATTEPTTQESPSPTTASSTTSPISNALLHVAPATQPTSLTEIGSTADNDKTYKMALMISPMGAGLNSVTLNEFKRAPLSPEPFVFQDPYTQSEASSHAYATQSVTING